MKKALTAVAIILCAIVAQSATVTWTFSGQNGTTGAPLNGAVAYLFNTADVSVANVTKAITDGTFASTYANSALASKATNSSGGITVAKIGNFSNEEVTLFTVVFDSADPSSGNVKVSQTVKKTFTTTNQTYNFNSALSSATWTAVPEPTTVALLALGLAALGLKRKVA